LPAATERGRLQEVGTWLVAAACKRPDATPASIYGLLRSFSAQSRWYRFRGAMSECVFCKIVAGDVPSEKVYEDDRILAFEDISPKAPTHILLIPKKHLENLNDGAADPALLGEIVARSATLARELGVPDFRLVTNTGREAGQVVFHLHFHLLAGRRMGWPPG
jgi:histidine triad (HIT) family protein